jgi:hypothetical protein
LFDYHLSGDVIVFFDRCAVNSYHDKCYGLQGFAYLRAKFLRKFLPSLVEGSRAAWCGGASGDEGRNYIRGESKIGYIESCGAV